MTNWNQPDWHQPDRHQQGPTRGFTLVELMVVVIIVGVLATLATFGVLKYVRSARVSEATAMVNDIKVAEEMYYDEKLQYLDGGGFGSWHPEVTPDLGQKVDWNSYDNAAGEAMRTLAVLSSGPVYFRYTVAASPGGNLPSLASLGLATPLSLPTSSTRPFYIVVARGNLDGAEDGEYTQVVGHSFDAAIHVDREGE